MPLNFHLTNENRHKLDYLQLISLFSIIDKRIFIFHCLCFAVVTLEQRQRINNLFFYNGYGPIDKLKTTKNNRKSII